MVSQSVNRTVAKLVSTLAILAVLSSPVTADGSEGEAFTWGGVMGANVNTASDRGQWGPGVEWGFGAGITDFWSIVAGVQASHHFALSEPEVSASQVGAVYGGFRYNLDVFKYVPFVSLSVNSFVLKPSPTSNAVRPDISLKFSVGCDWRYDRNWSVGVKASLHAPLAAPSNFPIYSSAGVNLAHHFRL